MVTVAEPGFYIELNRCNACAGAGWQDETVAAFRARGISAFAGTPKYDSSYKSIEFLERLPKVRDKLTSVFVGPFDSEASARRTASQLPSILRRQINEDRSSSVASATGLFEVDIKRVRSAIAKGSIGGLSIEAYVIRPGVGIGQVLLGNSRQQVSAALGTPRSRERDYDYYATGDETLSVYYSNGRVQQIEVSSPEFRTANGVSVASSPQQFTRLFPRARKLCCFYGGASGFSEWNCWDSVNSGITLRKGSHSGGSSLKAIVIHAPNVPVKQLSLDEESCKPCR